MIDDINIIVNITLCLLTAVITYFFTEFYTRTTMASSDKTKKLVSKLIYTAGDLYIKENSPAVALLLIEAAEFLMDPRWIKAHMNLDYQQMKPDLANMLKSRMVTKKERRKN